MVQIFSLCFGEPYQLRQAGHRAVIAHDFADDAHGPAAGQLDQIHRRFGVAGALQDAARLGAQREDMAGLDQIVRAPPSGSAMMRMVWARSAALMPVVMPRAASTLTWKSVLKFSRFCADHSLDAQLLEALGSGGHADQAAAVLGHEIDRRRA